MRQKHKKTLTVNTELHSETRLVHWCWGKWHRYRCLSWFQNLAGDRWRQLYVGRSETCPLFDVTSATCRHASDSEATSLLHNRHQHHQLSQMTHSTLLSDSDVTSLLHNRRQHHQLSQMTQYTVVHYFAKYTDPFQNSFTGRFSCNL